MKNKTESIAEKKESIIIKADSKKSWNHTKKKIEHFLDSATIQILMTIVTLYALIGEDLKLIYAPKMYDEIFTNLTIISLFLFTIELILSSFGYVNYLNSFFFWLDLVSTASLITDIEPIMDWLSGSSNE